MVIEQFFNPVLNETQGCADSNKKDIVYTVHVKAAEQCDTLFMICGSE
jgi:hypothetical protein